MRTEKYRKNIKEEDVISMMNSALSSVDKKLYEGVQDPHLPILFIIGAQRSGTTILMQLLTCYYHATFPNNLIARFWQAPYIGATLYKSIKGYLLDCPNDELSSDIGYTKGLNEPHEFGYYWKNWFPEECWNVNSPSLNIQGLKNQIGAWASVDNLPMIFKNLVQVGGNISTLKKTFPSAFFVHIERDLFFNAQSSFLSRLKFFGTPEGWLGVKPSNFYEIEKLPVLNQICEQIKATNRDIDQQLNLLEPNSFIKVRYEDLISHTEDVIKSIAVKSGIENYRNEKSFDTTLYDGNVVKIKGEELRELQSIVGA